MEYNFGECKKCKKKAVTAINAGDMPLCAYHYVEQEEESCLKSLLQHEIDEEGKITEDKKIQLEIKKQKPKLYHSFEPYFRV